MRASAPVVPMQRLSADARASVEAAVVSMGSLTKVAGRIGYSRPALSLAMKGAYRANSLQRMEAAIATKLGADVPCPHLGRTISTELCRQTRLQPVPTHDPGELKHWQACKSCPRNPASPTPPDPAARAVTPNSHNLKGGRHAQ